MIKNELFTQTIYHFLIVNKILGNLHHDPADAEKDGGEVWAWRQTVTETEEIREAGKTDYLAGLVVLLLDAFYLHLSEHSGLWVRLAQITVVNDTCAPQKGHRSEVPVCLKYCTGDIFNSVQFITWRSEGGELVEEVRVFLLTAHSTHCAHVQRQVSDQLACGQLIYLQDVLHIMKVVDQQVVLVHTGDKACRRIEKGSDRKWTWRRVAGVMKKQSTQGKQYSSCLTSCFLLLSESLFLC